jgi:hypothetical protein
MKTKLNKVRKTAKSVLKRRADKLFSQKVRSIGICMLRGQDNVKCGGFLQCAHIVGRVNHALRWDLQNALSLCAGHHAYYTNHPWDWRGIIQNLFPNNYKYLEVNKNKIWDKNIEKVIEQLEHMSLSKPIS